MTEQMFTHADGIIVREIDLGDHILFLKSDQSIEVACSQNASCEVQHVLSLDTCESYRLMRSLEDMFQNTC
jgi:ribosomal protein S1